MIKDNKNLKLKNFRIAIIFVLKKQIILYVKLAANMINFSLISQY